jgi:glycosyltransferase involved in cell wall biosynthesis
MGVLRVLIGSGNYPKLSESYIEAEIQYLLRNGVDVAVYSPRVGSPEAPEIVKVYRDMNQALSVHRPHIFHAHYLTFDPKAIDQASGAGIPVTIRGHSFDFTPEGARKMAARPGVKRIWLFPHFARLVGHDKVKALPVSFDSTLYKPFADKDRKLVYRTGAGKAGKGLADFFEISKLCPGFKFSLTANVVCGEESYLGVLGGLAGGAPVEYARNILRPEAVERMNRAGIYLDTSDPGSHAFGMPISIAEALATGCYVLARRNPAVEEYISGAGSLYGSVEEAAALIRGTEAWSEVKWRSVSEAAVARSYLFTDEHNLSAELEFFEAVLE